jgi:hypothetical protein
MHQEYLYESAAGAAEMWGCFSASIFVASQLVVRLSEPLLTVGALSASNALSRLTSLSVAPQQDIRCRYVAVCPTVFSRATSSTSRRPSVIQYESVHCYVMNLNSDTELCIIDCEVLPVIRQIQ